jgi:hypothetical protein
LTQKFAAAHGIDPATLPTPPGEPGHGIGGPATASLAEFPAIEIGGVLLRNPLVAIFGSGAGVMSSGEFFDGTLGGQTLRDFTVFLDYAAKQMILEAAAP